MTDNNNQPASFVNIPAYVPLERFGKQLKDAGLDDRSIGFLIGKLARLVDEGVLSEIGRLFSEEETAKIGEIKDNKEREDFIRSTFLQKKGQSLEEFRAELAEKVVKDFEAQR